MNRRQEMALAHFCRLATETVHPRYRWTLPGGYSLVLTVNTGYE